MFITPLPPGQYQTPSRIQDVHTYASFPPMDQMSQSTVASSGWFIGMVLALLFLASVCVVACLIKVFDIWMILGGANIQILIVEMTILRVKLKILRAEMTVKGVNEG